VSQFCSFRPYNASNFSYSIIALGAAIGLNIVLGIVLLLQVGYHFGTSRRAHLVLKCLVNSLATFEVAQTGMHFSVHLCTYPSFRALTHLLASSGSGIHWIYGAERLSYVILSWGFAAFAHLPIFLPRTETRPFVGVYSMIRLLNLPASTAAYGSSLQLPSTILTSDLSFSILSKSPQRSFRIST